MGVIELTWWRSFEYAYLNGWVSTRQITEIGGDRRQLSEKVNADLLRRTARGIYTLGRRPMFWSLPALMALHPGAVAVGETAAWLWKLMPEPNVWRLALPNKSRIPNSLHPTVVQFVRLRPKLFRSDVVTHCHQKTDLNVYSMERTVVDLVRFESPWAKEVLACWRNRQEPPESLLEVASRCRARAKVEALLDSQSEFLHSVLTLGHRATNLDSD